MRTYKIIDANQAKSINLYLNTKRKLLKCNANIKFNQISLAKNLTPQYAKIKISGHRSPARRTEKQAEKIRIKYEIKFLYKKCIEGFNKIPHIYIYIYNTQECVHIRL
jgi:hypothetical protein